MIARNAITTHRTDRRSEQRSALFLPTFFLFSRSGDPMDRIEIENSLTYSYPEIFQPAVRHRTVASCRTIRNDKYAAMILQSAGPDWSNAQSLEADYVMCAE